MRKKETFIEFKTYCKLCKGRNSIVSIHIPLQGCYLQGKVWENSTFLKIRVKSGSFYKSCKSLFKVSESQGI